MGKKSKTLLKLVAGVVAVVALGAAALVVSARMSWAQSRARVYAGVDGPNVTVRYDAASIARGEHLARSISACTECHDDDLGGRVFFDDPQLARFAGPNLTNGAGGLGPRLGERDWLRAITRGVGDSHRSLLLMPSRDYQTYSREDLAALVAWGRTRPPVERASVPPELRTMGYVLTMLGKLPAHSAEEADHRAQPRSQVTPGRSAEYGEYLAQSCNGCHRADLAGGPMAAAPPGVQAPPNLTQLAQQGWTEADFRRALRQGKSKSGRDLDPFMPWRAFRRMNDDEIGALWLRIAELGPKPTHTD